MESLISERSEEKEKELEALLLRFSGFIKSQIQKFDVQKLGIDPDDIAQEVRIKIWNLLRNEKNITCYSSYIKKIVDSSVIDQIRKLRREDHLFHAEKQKQVAEIENLYKPDSARRAALSETLAEAVESLIASRRNVVKLYLLNMSIEEISQYYNWSTHKTRNLLYRGLYDLKKAMKNAEADHDHRR
jgi:RNA polymerase sigma factor (sigma-70 family)